MTFEKALRVLPAFAAFLASDTTDLPRLRRNVEVEHFRLGQVIEEKLSQSHSQSFRSDAIRQIDLKREQLARFLETTK
jgi:hypothetical protein